MKASELIRIMQFADSALPIGGFTFSNGVEAAIQVGVVHDVATLKQFIQTLMQQTATCDGIALIAAHRHVLKRELNNIIETDWAVYNRKLNEEAQLMTVRMGKKLAELSVHVVEDPLLDWWLKQIKENNTPGTQPVTQAILMALQNIKERDVLVMHQYGIAMTVLSASIRLMRITHYETQRILFELGEIIEKSYSSAANGDISQMASYMPVVDVLSAIHTKSFVRLFMN